MKKIILISFTTLSLLTLFSQGTPIPGSRPSEEQENGTEDPTPSASVSESSRDSLQVPDVSIQEAYGFVREHAPAAMNHMENLKKLQARFDRSLVMHRDLRELHTRLLLAGDESSRQKAEKLTQNLQSSSQQLFKLSGMIYETTQKLNAELTRQWAGHPGDES
jgi:hypothetical protein